MLTLLVWAASLVDEVLTMSAQPIFPSPYSFTPAVASDAARPAMLMCAPTLYEVDYVINPWMAGNVHEASRERAMTQWRQLYKAVSQVAEVRLVEPQPGSPDMVFTANAGLERDGVVVLSSFFHAERQGEEAHFRQWFVEAGYHVVELPRETPFEGEGDALFASDGATLWVGYGPRTSLASHAELRHIWPVDVVSLHLKDLRFYHLDTCFAALSGGYAMYYPAAFDANSLAQIEAYYSPEKRIVVSKQDALRFACNAVNVGETIVSNHVSVALATELQEKGFTVVQVELGEFLKAGGAAKCLVLQLS